ncbi:WD repeat-containing protein 97-like [Myripristis murdjan]|uniref:WD repeat-containing protein 97-like n=1 Tax=Myripristis murdjan TaxID=586833 RepID=UPI001176172A|nr:WD repeat-containing protein 97-like [Myripristis murdjan]
MVVMASLASHETDESESDEKSRAPVLSPSPTLRLPSQPSEGRRKSRGKTPGQWEFHGPAVDENKQQVFTHGVHFLRHFPCDSPVRYMMYSEDAAAVVSLHTNNTARLYQADGHQLRSQAWSVPCPFTGLTSTKLPGHLVAWGPGENLVLLDSEFHYLDVAHEPLDIRVCQAAEHSTEVVTAGAGNVCVWSVRHMRCKVKILEGLQQSVFTQMALAPPTSSKPHRAFAVCGRVVTVVDLSAGKVLEHKTDLCLRNITALVFCAQLDCLIIASQDLSIRVWDQDWELCMAFVGHNGVVNSLLYCTEFGMLISASMDCTLRCWDVEKGDEVQCVHTEENSPPLFIGGPEKEGTFYSFSHHGVDFWTMNTLYTLHCKLRGDARLPLRQVLVPPFPAPYPTRALCVSGDSDVMLVAAETGAVLTSFMSKQRILCADYCLHKEVLLVLTEAGTVLQANTLTNPVTLMEEWQGRGLGPWQWESGMTRAQNLPNPGPACCLVLYSCIVETQRALKEWQSLQEERGHSHRKKATLDDAKNK